MKRFILLSFGFLGLAFYELSGGADFDPVEARNAAVLARGGAVDQIDDTQIAQGDAARQEVASVTRMSLDLTSLNDVLEEREPAAEQAAPSIVPKPEVAAVTAVTFETPGDPDIVLPSIIFPGSTTQASSDAVTQPRDVRYVSASVVNMRGGPGTGFDVITKLERDTEVEVLEDDGTGWVRLRPVAGGPEGWIADFLLTNG